MLRSTPRRRQPAAITAAVKAHGYPAGADPAEINYPMTIFVAGHLGLPT